MDFHPILILSRSRNAGCPKSTATYLTASNSSFSTAASWFLSQTMPTLTESSSTLLNNRQHTAHMMKMPVSVRLHGRGKGRNRRTLVTASGGPSKVEFVPSCFAIIFHIILSHASVAPDASGSIDPGVYLHWNWSSFALLQKRRWPEWLTATILGICSLFSVAVPSSSDRSCFLHFLSYFHRRTAHNSFLKRTSPRRPHHHLFVSFEQSVPNVFEGTTRDGVFFF